MNKKVSLGVTICFMAIAAAVTFTFTMYFALNIFNSKISNVSEREELYSKVAEIDTIVRGNALAGEIDEESLLDSLAKGYMSGLKDDYAYYMTQEEYKSYQQTSEGQIIGIGATAREDESGYIYVISVAAGSASEAAGLQGGDLIIKVDGTDVLVSGYDTALESLKGEEGTALSLTVRRNNEEFELEVIRKGDNESTVFYEQVDDYGYIKITTFDSTTPADFEYALYEMFSLEVKGLIFDVRDNQGGLVSSVAEVLDKLLPEGTLVSQTDRDGNTTVLYSSGEESINMPMAVLVNGNTASAAELFACDLRDFNAASLIGETTYGKGVLQTVYPLEDGSAICLTTAYYNPASGINFHGVGVKPDYRVTLTAEQQKNLSALDKSQDPQLQKAIFVLKAQ